MVLQAIASVAKGDEDFIKALKDPLYVRIREALYSTNKPNKLLYLEDLEDNKDTCPKENLIGTIADDTTDTKQKVLGEIEEEQTDESRHREEAPNGVHHFMKIQVPDNYCRNDNLKSVCIRPKVEEALGTLEKVISLVREVGFNDQSRYTVGFTKHEEVNNLEKDDGMGDLSSSNNGLCSDNMICIEVSKEENANRTLDEPRNSSGRYSFDFMNIFVIFHMWKYLSIMQVRISCINFMSVTLLPQSKAFKKILLNHISKTICNYKFRKGMAFDICTYNFTFYLKSIGK